ncbi:MAG: MMPL family transporter [Nanoarchaeota archaeon]
MRILKHLLEGYARLVAHHPFIVLSAVAILTVISLVAASGIQTQSSDFEDLLPEGYPVIDGFTKINEFFGGVETVTVVTRITPQQIGSNEVRDVRDPRLLLYQSRIATMLQRVEYVIDVSSPSLLIRQQSDGRIPQDIRKIQGLTGKNPAYSTFMSPSYDLSLIRVRLSDDADSFLIAQELSSLVADYPPPPGVAVELGGGVMENVAVENLIPADMARTSRWSLIGIAVVILLVFRSVRYGFTPLSTILFGTIWAFGIVGLLGIGLTSQTSGVISMIMGIGIDFGIQTITRYRQERERHERNAEAMQLTLQRVIPPMVTTTIAAIIGFQAMALGELTFLGDMGQMMSFGVLGSFLAAITAVPSIMLLIDNLIDHYRTKV